MGLLTVKVENSAGQAVAGATVTATIVGDKSTCQGDSLTLGTTGEAGQVGAAVMYQTYVVTATVAGHSLTKTVTVSSTSVTATATTSQATTYQLPSPVVFVT